MQLTDIIGDKIQIQFPKTVEAVCWICQSCTTCYTDVVSSNFTNREDVTSTDFCFDCSKLFHSDYRKRSFYITQQDARLMKQNEFYEALHNLSFPCILSFTESNKKHRLFRSKISHDRNNITVTTDNTHIYLDLDEDLPILQAIQKFYQENKVSKSWIVTWDYPVGALVKIWIDARQEFEKVVAPLRWTSKFPYLVMRVNK